MAIVLVTVTLSVSVVMIMMAEVMVVAAGKAEHEAQGKDRKSQLPKLCFHGACSRWFEQRAEYLSE